MRFAVVSSLFGIGLLMLAAGLVYSFSSFNAEPQSFSQEEWTSLRGSLELSADPGCLLGGFTKELLDKGILDGKTKQFVLGRLGSPSKEDASSFAYFIGQCHGWGWHASELVIGFSEAGVVSVARVRKVR